MDKMKENKLQDSLTEEINMYKKENGKNPNKVYMNFNTINNLPILEDEECEEDCGCGYSIDIKGIDIYVDDRLTDNEIVLE